MICTYCGTQIPDGTAFCTNCGAKMPVNEAPQMPRTDVPPVSAPTQTPMQPTPAPSTYQSPAGGSSIAGMPNTTTAIVLIVIGFLCGILWGIIGVVQYGPMKTAIEAGDVETANKKFNVIKIATIIGVVLNVLLIFSGVLNR